MISASVFRIRLKESILQPDQLSTLHPSFTFLLMMLEAKLDCTFAPLFFPFSSPWYLP